MSESKIYSELVKLRRRFDGAVDDAWCFLRAQFVEQLPAESLQNLPSPYIYWSGGFIYAVLLAIFVSIFVSVFLNTRAERFLSLTDDGMICDTVYKEFTGVYLIDNNGNWEGSADFLYTRAVYQFTINKFVGTSDDFSALMDTALEAIDYIGQAALNFNLGLNLVSWMMYQATANYKGSNQIISLTGSPKAIFDRNTLAGNLNNLNGTCDVIPRVSYFRSDAKVEFEYDYDAYASSPVCMGILNPDHIGFDQSLSQGDLRISLGVEAIITATGVNLGLLGFDELQEIPGTTFSYSYKGKEFVLKRYFYPRFLGMSSLICYGDDSVGFTCAIEIGINCHTTCAICLIKAGFIGDGGVVGYPLFDHAGFDTSNPRSCVCGVGPSEFDLIACNEFRLLGGVLFFSDEGGYSLDSFFEFVLFSGYSATDIHELAFNISFDTAIKTNKYKNDVAWRNSSFDFCTKSEIFNASCGVLGFYTGGYDFAVSEYYFPVYRGACNDSFTLPTEVQEKLKSSPPAKFTEIYLECRNGFFEVINISIGLAMGNLAMYIPAAVFLATCLMALYSRIFHVTMAKTYTAQERDDILQFLAFNLLLARDGHYKFNPGPDGHSIKGQGNFELSSNSIVTALKDELAVKAYISRFISVAPDNPTSNHEKKSEMGVELAEIGGGVESAAKMTDTYELNERLKSSDYIENPLAKK